MIIATAGHVDHGKTTLIKALTGVETDRLPEEKIRSMTIEPGFAYLHLNGTEGNFDMGSTDSIAFIDVPGHQGFIRNMLCGVSGADFALMVVAADDGLMPQTNEHLSLLCLLDIEITAVALTKIDRVHPSRITEVRDQIDLLLVDTPSSNAPIFEVAAPEDIGISALKKHLFERAKAFAHRGAPGNFRLPIDRCFNLPGAGLIVTGTAAYGTLATGDTVRMLSSGTTARVRSIHAQNRDAIRGSSGQRCALNLASTNLKKSDVIRGDWIVSSEVPPAQSKIDVRLHFLGSQACNLANGTHVHVHLGTSHVMARILTLEGKSIRPGESGWAQLVFGRPIGAVFGDRFVVRDQSAQLTLGGGKVIDIFPPLRGRSKPDRLSILAALEADDHVVALERVLELKNAGLQLNEFSAGRNMTSEEATALFRCVDMVTIATNNGLVAFSPSRWSDLRSAIFADLTTWHEKHPAMIGPPLNQLLIEGPLRIPEETLYAVVTSLAQEGEIVRNGMGVRRSDHIPRLNKVDEALWCKIERLLATGHLRPPSLSELSFALSENVSKIEATAQRAAHCGRAFRVSSKRYFLPAPVIELAEMMRTLALQSPEGKVAASAFRDHSGIGRNMTIEVLDFFDRVKFTRRLGAGHKCNHDPREFFGATS